MDLSTLSIRELFTELTTVEDALQGRSEQRLSASRRRVLEQHQDRLCQELRSRPSAGTPHRATPHRATPHLATPQDARQASGTVPA